MRPFVFENPPLMDTQDGTILGEYLGRQFQKLHQSLGSLGRIVTWEGNWSQGAYAPYQMVIDGGWLAIANKQTTDRPAPQTTGDPSYTVPDVASWIPGVDPGWVWTANLFTVQSSGWVEQVRVWIPTTDTDRVHRILILEWIDIPTNRYRILADFLIPQSAYAVGWYAVDADIVWYAGRQYEVAILSENTSTPALGFQGQWQYAGASQSGTPYWGGWNHNNQHTTIRFHEQQSGGLGSAALWLDELGPGDTVTITTASATWEYDITSPPSKDGQIYSYSCARTLASGSISTGQECNVEWGDPGAQPDTEYVELPGHWSVNTPPWASSVQGILNDGNARSNSDSAYGTDILFQEAYVSDDWDLLAYTD